MRPQRPLRKIDPATAVGHRPAGQVLGVIALLVVGAVLAISVERLVGASAGPAASDALGAGQTSAIDEATPEDTGQPGASDQPSGATTSSVLEAQLPQSVNGTPLTTQSSTDATSLTNSPNGRALDAAVIKLGKQATDLEIALDYDDSGTTDLSIIGFRVAGVSAATLRPLILEAWLASSTPGVTSTSVDLAGTPVTDISYGDGGPHEYVMVHGDSIFVIETADQSLASNVVTDIEATAPTSSPAPSVIAPVPSLLAPSPSSAPTPS